MKIIALVCLLVGSCLADTTVQKLVTDGRFNTLVQLVTQAKLVNTLNGGNYTIFAPTDAAFAKIPSSDIAMITSDSALLEKVLTYHVVSGVVKSMDAKNELVVSTVSGAGARFNIYTHNNMNTVTIEGSKISTFDMEASNGVIHVIESVMMMPKGDIVKEVAESPDHRTLLSLVKQAGLASALQNQAITVFAPTDAAFAKLPNATLTAVLNDTALLKNVLMYHVVASTQYSAGLYDMEMVPTLLTGKNITVHINKKVMINDATVTMADMSATNGVIHVIDRVLVPPTRISGPIVG